MRIDSSLYSDSTIALDPSKRPLGSARTNSERSDKALDDTAEFSTSDDSVRFVESEIQELPDVRQERVAALRSCIENNNYFVSPEKIADAMYREMASLPRVPQPE